MNPSPSRGRPTDGLAAWPSARARHKPKNANGARERALPKAPSVVIFAGRRALCLHLAMRSICGPGCVRWGALHTRKPRITAIGACVVLNRTPERGLVFLVFYVADVRQISVCVHPIVAYTSIASPHSNPHPTATATEQRAASKSPRPTRAATAQQARADLTLRWPRLRLRPTTAQQAPCWWIYPLKQRPVWPP